MEEKEQRTCELCDSKAAIYCPSDSAFLCSSCDTAVHQANFLVARHLRFSLTSSKRHRFNDSPFPSSSSSSSSESYAISSKKTATIATTLDLSQKAEKGITTKTKNNNNSSSTTTTSLSSVITNGASSCSLFMKWSRELEIGGVNGNFVTSLASRALGFCLGRWKGLPFRVAAATSFWFGLRFCCDQKNQNMMIARLELISGVPAKLILAAHAKLARVFTLRRREYYYLPRRQQEEEEERGEEEGWDEC